MLLLIIYLFIIMISAEIYRFLLIPLLATLFVLPAPDEFNVNRLSLAAEVCEALCTVGWFCVNGLFGAVLELELVLLVVLEFGDVVVIVVELVSLENPLCLLFCSFGVAGTIRLPLKMLNKRM